MTIEPFPATSASPAPPALAPAIGRWQAALSGVVAAGLALATGELVAAFVPGAISPLVAVGAAVIDFAPPGSKDFMVSLFGTNDKLALLIVVGAAVLAFGALIGLLARRSTMAAGVAIFVLTGVGALAGLRDPTSSMTAVFASWTVQSVVGYVALTTLLGAAQPRTGVRHLGARGRGGDPPAVPRLGRRAGRPRGRRRRTGPLDAQRARRERRRGRGRDPAGDRRRFHPPARTTGSRSPASRRW